MSYGRTGTGPVHMLRRDGTYCGQPLPQTLVNREEFDYEGELCQDCIRAE